MEFSEMMSIAFPLSGGLRYETSGKFVAEEGGAVHPRRTLESHVLLFGSSGESRIAVGGEDCRLAPGVFLLMPARIEHRGTMPSTPNFSYYWCHFRAEEPTGPSLSLLLCGRAASAEQVRLLFHQMIDAAHSENRYRAEICSTTLSLILMELAGRDTVEDGLSRSLAANAARVVEWIRLYATEIKSVGEVAAHFGYNSEYLTTALRQATGKTLVEHIRAARINEAKNLLLCSELHVKEIAFRCGYSDEKYFLKVFRQETDLTPGQYRSACFHLHYNRS